MENSENIINEAEIKKLLSNLREETHIPFEVMLADVEGKLSPDGHSKIAKHIEACKECTNVFRQIKDSLDLKEDSDEKDKAVSSISVDAALVPKLKLAATVNSQKDEIAKEMTQLLLPEDSWFCIKPAVAVYRDWLKSPIKEDAGDLKELQIAAFAGGSDEDREHFEVVTVVIKFVDYICDLLVERCNSIKDVKQKLSEIAPDAWSIFGKIKLDQKIKNNVLEVMENLLVR